MVDDLSPGSIVRHLPDGPEMVVRLIGEGPLGSGACAMCHWVDEAGLQTAMFPLETLSIVPNRLPPTKQGHVGFASARLAVQPAAWNPLARMLLSLRKAWHRG